MDIDKMIEQLEIKKTALERALTALKEIKSMESTTSKRSQGMKKAWERKKSPDSPPETPQS